MTINNNSKQFDLGTILTITSAKCRLFTEIENLYIILDYLTGSTHLTHELPRAHEIARPYVLSLYPNLEGVGDDVVIESYEDLEKFLTEQKKIFGETLALSPIPKGYSYIELTSGLKDTPKSKKKKYPNQR